MTKFTVPCPYDGKPLECEVTFEGDPPYFNLEAADVMSHMRAEHPDL